MTLAVHALIGAAVGHSLGIRNPAVLLLVGVATHYLSDAIPHWDWRLSSFPGEEKSTATARRWIFTSASFVRDITRVALDSALGILLIALLVSRATFIPALLAAFGGMAPDILQGIYFTGYAPFLTPMQKFHDFCHTKIRLGPYPVIGIPFQIAIALAALYFLR